VFKGLSSEHYSAGGIQQVGDIRQARPRAEPVGLKRPHLARGLRHTKVAERSLACLVLFGRGHRISRSIRTRSAPAAAAFSKRWGRVAGATSRLPVGDALLSVMMRSPLGALGFNSVLVDRGCNLERRQDDGSGGTCRIEAKEREERENVRDYRKPRALKQGPTEHGRGAVSLIACCPFLRLPERLRQ
jgi:hypothetical protein